MRCWRWLFAFFFQAEDGIRDLTVTGVQTCALPIATSAPGQPFINPILEGLGLFVISPPAKYTYGYKPGYIEISNLELRNAKMTNSYVNAAGQTVAWQKFGSGVYIERAENVTIRNCHIHDNGLGVFQNSKFDE